MSADDVYGGSVTAALPEVNVPPAPPDVSGSILGGAAVTGVGSLISSGVNMYSAYQNRKWQEKMANTAHQREVADLRAAGLNPILSATRGGAAVPSGGFGTMSNPAESVAGASAAAAQSKFTRENVLNQNLATAAQYASTLLDLQGKRQSNRITTAEADRQWMVNEKLLADTSLSRASAAGVEAARAKDAAFQPFFDKLGNTIQFVLDKLFPRQYPAGEVPGGKSGRHGASGSW